MIHMAKGAKTKREKGRLLQTVVDEQLHDWVKAQAKKDNRSVSQFIMVVLQRAHSGWMKGVRGRDE